MKREEYLDDYQDHAERRPKKKKRRKNENIEFMLFCIALCLFNSCTWNFYFVSCPESRSEGK